MSLTKCEVCISLLSDSCFSELPVKVGNEGNGFEDDEHDKVVDVE